jgi:hypothetical protein
MKNILAIALLGAMAATAVPVFAQEAPPTPNPQMRQQFQQMRSQMKQIHDAERAQMLNALTPQHKSLLATVVGRIATSVNPDVNGAARQLDAALSSGEKQAVVSAAQTARSKERALFETMRSQMPSPPPGAHVHRVYAEGFGEGRRTPDAGRLLLRLAAPGPGMMGSVMIREKGKP